MTGIPKRTIPAVNSAADSLFMASALVFPMTRKLTVNIRITIIDISFFIVLPPFISLKHYALFDLPHLLSNMHRGCIFVFLTSG
jgi:hypothetical protein